MVVAAPLFGYKFDLIVTALNDLDASEKALADPQVVDPTYGGYSGYSEAAPQPLQGYRMMPSGGALTALGARILRRSAARTSLTHHTLPGLTWGHTHTHTQGGDDLTVHTHKQTLKCSQ